MGRLKFAAVAVLFAMALSSAARADLSVCNQSQSSVDVTFANVTNTNVRGGMTASGILAITFGNPPWYTVMAGQCIDLWKGNTYFDRNQHFYMYARSAAGKVWDGEAGGGDSSGRSTGPSTTVADQFGYNWPFRLSICEPTANKVTTEDPFDNSRTCHLLSFFMVSIDPGTNFRMTLD